MTTTRLFKNGNSQAVRIPAEFAFPTNDMELVIERVGEELRIRPAQRRIGNVLQALAEFSPNFMPGGRGEQEQTEREDL
jgi:antitoxin VapB